MPAGEIPSGRADRPARRRKQRHDDRRVKGRSAIVLPRLPGAQATGGATSPLIHDRKGPRRGGCPRRKAGGGERMDGDTGRGRGRLGARWTTIRPSWRSLQRGLRLAGFAVDLAEGGRPALDLVRQQPTDASCWTSPCPISSGIQVCRTLRERQRRARTDALGTGETTDRIAGTAGLGGDDYLVEPSRCRNWCSAGGAVAATTAEGHRRGADGRAVLDPAAREVRLDDELGLTRAGSSTAGGPRTQRGHRADRDHCSTGSGVRLRRAHRRRDTFVRASRRKLEARRPAGIHTVRGVGSSCAAKTGAGR